MPVLGDADPVTAQSWTESGMEEIDVGKYRGLVGGRGSVVYPKCQVCNVSRQCNMYPGNAMYPLVIALASTDGARKSVRVGGCDSVT